MMRILFLLFAGALRVAEACERLAAWWRSIDEPVTTIPRPMFWGWCCQCDKPGLITKHWRCERCGSGSVINVRAGGDESVRA